MEQRDTPEASNVHNAWDLSDLSSSDSFSYIQRPMCFYLTLARYKFAAKLLKPHDITLDAGCGAGVGTHFVSKFCARTVGVDIDTESIGRCREMFGEESIEFVSADLTDPEALSQAAGEVSAIVCNYVI